MPNLERKKVYSAFTLLEILVVLSMFMILSAITLSSFGGLRDTIALNEDILNLEQDIRYAQRSAMFLDREVGENWIYGIGIDFSRLEDEKEYNLFKWCSQYDEYGPIRTTSPIPNYNPNEAWGLTNANLPTTYSSGACDYIDGSTRMVKVLGEVDGSITSNMNVSVGVLLPETDIMDIPQYILFEAVSGRMFVYNSAGAVINYYDGDLLDNPTDFVLEVSSPNTDVIRRVSIDNISGKLLIEKIDEV